MLLQAGCIYKKLNSKCPRPYLLNTKNGYAKFGFALPSRISIKPGKTRTVHMGIRLFCASGMKILPAKELVNNYTLLVVPLQQAKKVRYVDSLSFRIKNMSYHYTAVFPAGKIFCTVLIKNFLTSRYSLFQCDNLTGKYTLSSDDENLDFSVEYTNTKVSSFQVEEQQQQQQQV